MPFDGATYDPTQDKDRLGRQLRLVKAVMLDGAWHRLMELAEYTGGSEAAISARIRDLRKAKFGAFTVERRRVTGEKGLWEYRVVLP